MAKSCRVATSQRTAHVQDSRRGVLDLISSCSRSASGSTSRRVLILSKTLLFSCSSSAASALGPAACQLLLGVAPHGQWARLGEFRSALIDWSARTRGAISLCLDFSFRLRQHPSWLEPSSASCLTATSRVQCCALAASPAAVPTALRGRLRSTQSTVHRTPSNLEVRSSTLRRCFELPSGRSVRSPSVSSCETFASWTSCSSRCAWKNRQVHITTGTRPRDVKCSCWELETP